MNVIAKYLFALENRLITLVTSHESETLTSNNAVRGFHPFILVSMKNRLLFFTLIHIHYGMEVSRERAVDIFSENSPQKDAGGKYFVVQSGLGTSKS